MSAIKVGLIGGSGLGEAMLARAHGVRHEIKTPFGPPSDAIVEMQWAGLPVYFLSRHAPGHRLSPARVPYRANIFALKQLGCTHVIGSGAVGSLRDEFKPRDLVIPDQLIDKTFARPSTFFENAAVHVEFAEPFCPVLRRILIEAGSAETTAAPSAEAARAAVAGEASPPQPAPVARVHDHGCYVCMEGPAFSTRAESLMHRLWGGDLIGMTAMPEAKLAREAEMSYALVALVTDYDSWRRPPKPEAPKPDSSAKPADQKTGAALEMDQESLLKEIIANLRKASDNAVGLIERALVRLAGADLSSLVSPAHEALKLALWTEKSRIPADEVQRLGPLWMKYFEGPEVSGGERL